MPSSAASTRVDGSGVLARSRPERTASRSSRSSWADNEPGPLRSSRTSSSGARLRLVNWSTKSSLKWTLTVTIAGSTVAARTNEKEDTMGRIAIFGGTVLALLVAAAALGASGTPEVVARIATGAGACSEVGGFGYVWVGNNGAGTLSRIDPATNKVTATIGVGHGPCGVAIGAGSVWVDGYSSESVIRVNPATLKIVKRIHLPDSIWDVTYGAGAVWATESTNGYVDRISPKRNKLRKRIRIPGFVGPANLRYGAGAVWVGAQLGHKIFRIDA